MMCVCFSPFGVVLQARGGAVLNSLTPVLKLKKFEAFNVSPLL